MKIFQLKSLCLSFIIASMSFSALSQFSEGKLVALPIAYYTPETSLALGGGALYTYQAEADSSLRRSQLQFGAIYTLNKQILLYLPYDIYTKGDEWYFSGEVGYYKYFYYYFGLGAETEISDQETYNIDYPRLIFNVQKQWFDDFFAGIRLQYDYFHNLEIEEDGLLDGSEITGLQAGAILKSGLTLTLDKRNHNFYPSDGHLTEASLTFSSKDFFSDYSYGLYRLSHSQYIGLFKSDVLALNGFIEGRTGSPPFFDYALLGGGKNLRGFLEGRYRGDVVTGLRLEYRKWLFWRIGAVAFANAGSIIFNEDVFTDLYPSAGLGIRALLDKKNKVNIRLDYAISKDGGYFYLTFGEAF